jgi:hypothetical protein
MLAAIPVREVRAMLFDPNRFAAEQAERLTRFPPDPMAWNTFLWAAWSSWLMMVGLDPWAWQRTWMSAFESPLGPWLSMPATMPVAANDESDIVALPEGEPVPPSFA